MRFAIIALLGLVSIQAIKLRLEEEQCGPGSNPCPEPTYEQQLQNLQNATDLAQVSDKPAGEETEAQAKGWSMKEQNELKKEVNEAKKEVKKDKKQVKNKQKEKKDLAKELLDVPELKVKQSEVKKALEEVNKLPEVMEMKNKQKEVNELKNKLKNVPEMKDMQNEVKEAKQQVKKDKQELKALEKGLQKGRHYFVKGLQDKLEEVKGGKGGEEADDLQDKLEEVVEEITEETTEAETEETSATEVLCAQERGICNCVGTVHYGNGVTFDEMMEAGRVASKPSENQLSCNNNVFGDPAHGIKKHCVCESNTAV